MNAHGKRPCVFFDRDGIVNRDPGAGYVERPEDFHLLPAFVEALRVATDRGYAAVVVTNQRGVGRGLMTCDALAHIHGRLRAELAGQGLALTAIESCTATDDADPRRKPNPGMLLDAAARHGLDVSASWMVGDRERDVEAGRRAGCGTTVRVGGGDPTRADHRVPDMDGLVALLRERLPGPPA